MSSLTASALSREQQVTVMDERVRTLKTLLEAGFTTPPRYHARWRSDMVHLGIDGWADSVLTRRELLQALSPERRERQLEKWEVYSVDLDASDCQPVRLPYLRHHDPLDLIGWIDRCHKNQHIAEGYYLSKVWHPRAVNQLLDLRAAAARLGVSYATLRAYRAQDPSFPDPDVMLGQSPGWLPSTLDDWQATRPGRGAGGGRPRKNT